LHNTQTREIINFKIILKIDKLKKIFSSTIIVQMFLFGLYIYPWPEKEMVSETLIIGEDIFVIQLLLIKGGRIEEFWFTPLTNRVLRDLRMSLDGFLKADRVKRVNFIFFKVMLYACNMRFNFSNSFYFFY
jgi:hypothetical protein